LIIHRKILGAAVLGLFLAAASCPAQDAAGIIDRSKIPAEASSPAGFVPHGWKIEEQLRGDLDGDSIADYVLKLVEDKAEKTSEGYATERGRALVVALQKAESKLTRAAVAAKLLQCTLCGGSFYGVSESPADVAIEKGVIVVDFDHGGSDLSNLTFRFRYDPATAKFILIGFDYADADRRTAKVISESTNYVTGVRKTSRDKGNKTINTTTRIPKTKIYLDNADYEKLEAEALKRLGLD
jgi:hypothetical protein